MKLIRTLQFPLTAAAVFAASLALGAFAMTTFDAPATVDADAAHAAWVSRAETVAQQTQEADLVVRVQAVDRAQPRALWSPTPQSASLDARGTFLFTDTEIEVLEVYKGDATVGDRVWVLQTGGEADDLRGAKVAMEIAEDPIYGLGDEMVLFLVDISDDTVHAQGRDLFRTVNPEGRYAVDGNLVSRVDLGTDRGVVESDLGTLEGEIARALATR